MQILDRKGLIVGSILLSVGIIVAIWAPISYVLKTKEYNQILTNCFMGCSQTTQNYLLEELKPLISFLRSFIIIGLGIGVVIALIGISFIEKCIYKDRERKVNRV